MWFLSFTLLIRHITLTCSHVLSDPCILEINATLWCVHPFLYVAVFSLLVFYWEILHLYSQGILLCRLSFLMSSLALKLGQDRPHKMRGTVPFSSSFWKSCKSRCYSSWNIWQNSPGQPYWPRLFLWVLSETNLITSLVLGPFTFSISSWVSFQ